MICYWCLIKVKFSLPGSNLEAITTCELCKEKLRLNIENFDVQELYKTHVQVGRCSCSEKRNDRSLLNLDVLCKELKSIFCDLIAFIYLFFLFLKGKKKSKQLRSFHSPQSRFEEFISSGFYLVVLLQFCEQRFSDVLREVDTARVRKLAFTRWIK